MHVVPGDTVSCKFSSTRLTNAISSDFDEILSFDVIAKDDKGYYLYIPHYVLLRETSIISKSIADNLKILSRFIGENFLYVTFHNVVSVRKGIEGATCMKCDEFFPYAESNPDGKTICFVCRKYRYFMKPKP